MTVRLRRVVVFCGVVPTLVCVALCLSRPSSLTRLEWRVYDVMVRTIRPRPPAGRVVIVDVDERSLTTVGQWPWRRDLIGTLIGNLRDLGATTVALDIMFAEEDRSRGAGVNPDEALAESLRAGRVVLGYALTFDEPAEAPRACEHHPLGLAVVRADDTGGDQPFFRATTAICNLPNLARAAGASGFLNAAPDPDGILRRVPLVVEFEGRVYPALALAAVSAATGRRGVMLRAAHANASTLLMGADDVPSAPAAAPATDVHVPLDGKSNLLLRYRGVKHTFPYVSAVDVLNGRVEPGTFKDKIAFVGTSALGTREVVSTPLDTVFTGVEVQATVADNLLQQDFVRRPDYSVVLEALAVLAFGLVATLIAVRFGLLWGAAGVAVSLTAVWTMTIAQLSASGTFLSPLFPTMGVSSAIVCMMGAQAVVERIRADRAGQEKATTERVMVQALLSLVEIRDTETGRHSRRTQQYTRLLAQVLATHPAYRSFLTAERIDLISTLAPLHDIGKVGVPDKLLNKPGALTDDEMAEMRKHPVYGRDVILKTERDVGVRDDLTLAIAKDIVYTHHEKWDGTGYPQGLRGTQIPIPGRIVGLVDVYDAVRSRRVYAAPLSHEEAVALIVDRRGAHFDPAVVDAFLKVSSILQTLSEHEDAKELAVT